MTTRPGSLLTSVVPKIALALLGLGVFASTSAAQYLYNRADLATGQTPIALVTADFNHDGLPDLAVANRDDNTVSIFLAKPDGTFAAQVTYATGPSPAGVIASDFNGDGAPDLAVINSNPAGTGSVSILLGNGDGTFQNQVQYQVGTNPIGIVAADFNGDQKTDLAVANNADSTVSILIGSGNGTFQAGTTAPLPGYPQTLAAGDFNGDGKTDLIALNSVVSVLLSKSDGTFTRVDTSLIAYPSSGIAVGDFNGDHVLDVVVGDSSPLGFYQPQLLLGNGDGTFAVQAGALTVNIASADAITAADFNHDGKLDLAFSGHGVGAAASIALGNGDGTFNFPILTGPVISATPLTPIVTGDFNGDGVLDFAEVNPPGAVSIMLGNGDGTFGREVNYEAAASGGEGPEVVADFNDDGKPDVAVRTTSGGITGGSVAVLLGNGDGTLSSAMSSTAGTAGLVAIAQGDFNHDGKKDVAVDDGGSVSVLLGNSDGTFQAPVDTVIDPTFTVQAIATGDFNGDGHSDAAVSVYDSSIGGSRVAILLGSSGAALTAGASYVLPNHAQASYSVVADFNNDKKMDFALVDRLTSSVFVFLGNGDGSFQAPVAYTVSYADALDVGDVNGDNKLDLVAASGFGTSVLLGNGNGTFQAHLDSVVPRFSSFTLTNLVVADFNGDGRLDVGTYTNGYGYVLLGNGDGTFRAPYSYHGASNAGFVAAADFNGDGTSDLVIDSVLLSPTEPTITLLLSEPAVNLAPSSLDFADQVIGTPSAAESMVVTNVGSAPLTITSVASGGDFTQTNTCGGTLLVGAGCQVHVTFTPSGSGSRTGALVIIDDTNGVAASTQMVALEGTGLSGPVVGSLPASLTFTDQAVGSTSTAQAVKLKNSGGSPLAVSSIAVDGNFDQTNSCGASVAAGANCTISVTFKPTAAGARAGTLTITDNDNGVAGSTQTVSLTGTGTGPVVSLSPALTFAALTVGSTSNSQIVTLTNTGGASLTFSAAPAVTGPFAIAGSGTTCSTASPIAPAGNCTVAVTFAPTAGGAASGSLSFEDNAPASPQTVALSGTGEDFTFSSPSGSSTTATASPGQTATYTLSVGGEGGLNQAVAFTCTGAPSEANCTVSPNPVTPGNSATDVTVTVTTTAASRGVPRLLPLHPLSPGPQGRNGLWLLALLLAALAWTVRQRDQTGADRWRSQLAKLALGLSLIFVLAGCGEGGSASGPSPNPGTPAGTYSLTVTGTTGSGASAVSHAVKLTLTVS